MKKRFTEAQIIGFLREAEAGLPVKDLCRQHGFSEASYYLWRSKFDGMSVSDAKRLKELETENGRLKKLLAESHLEIEVTREVLRKKMVTAPVRREMVREMVARDLSERRALTVGRMSASTFPAFGEQILDVLCPPATRTRRWPTRDRRSVTTAGVAMVPRSGIVKLTESSSINPQDTGLQPVANPPCWASKTAVSPNLTIPAFELLVLTAARSGEVRLATWDEINTTDHVWTIPATRMKANREHRVPLCGRATEILEAARALSEGRSPLVFSTPRGKPLDAQRLVHLLRTHQIAAVPHGFLSSFRDWAAEETNHPREVIEAAPALDGRLGPRQSRRGNCFYKLMMAKDFWR